MESELLKQNFALRKENKRLKKENEQLKNENIELKCEVNRLKNQLQYAHKQIKDLKNELKEYKKNEKTRIEDIVNKAVSKAVSKTVSELNKAHEIEVANLKSQIKKLETRLGMDSTNSNIPTSKQSIGKHIIQNNREKTGKPKGAPRGHSIHKLEYFKDEEITAIVEHTLGECPDCGGTLIETNVVRSDIIDIRITIDKTRNNIHNYVCKNCKKKISANNKLPRKVSYGSNINTIILSLMNEANTPLNKIVSFLSGLTNNEINVSEGYLVKLQKKAANSLDCFTPELKTKIISLSRLFWDDTVVNIGLEEPEEGYDEKDLAYMESIKDKEQPPTKRQGIIRFYGNDSWAYLVGHRNKNEKSLDDDDILINLPSSCVVMHDHLLHNYNIKYDFQNAECNEHAKKYLKMNMVMFPTHKWAKSLRDLLIRINHHKKEVITNGDTCFSDAQLKEYSDLYDQYIKLGYEENASLVVSINDENDELNLIKRLEKFKDNHLLFMRDFSVDFTNNTAERGLRQTKRKLAVSFMFKNANRMKDYAKILSYIETCFRHGISRFESLKRLLDNNPFTVSELSELDEKKRLLLREIIFS